MNIYVAGRTLDIPKVRIIQGLVKSTGHEITYDWTQDVEQHGSGMPGSPELRQGCAMRDMGGVYRSSLLIAVGHPSPLSGTLWECGMAAAWNIPIWLVDWQLCTNHSIFEDLPHVRQLTVQQVGEELWTFSEKRLERELPPTRITPHDG